LPERVGRDGFLSLDFERRADRTVLVRSRFKLPLQVLAPSCIDDGSAYLLLLNPTGGIVGGDCLETEIRLRKGSHVCLTTPSATAVYRALNRPAIQRTTIRLEEDSVLECFPEHVIPYAGSALLQSVRVEMASRSCLVLADAFSAGRIARGERWKFKELVNKTEVRLGNSPVYLSQSKIVPSEPFPDCLGVMEDFNYAASLVVFSDGFPRWKNLVDKLSVILDAVPELQGGISMAGQSGCVIRMLASTAADITGVTQNLWTCIRKIVLNAQPLARRKY
jgi:urease accessory protein